MTTKNRKKAKGFEKPINNLLFKKIKNTVQMGYICVKHINK